MKYKGKIEISKDEMDCLFGWLEKFIKLDHALSGKVTKAVNRVHKELKNQQNNNDSEESEVDSEDDSLDWEEEVSEENIEEVHEPIAMEEYKKKDEPVQDKWATEGEALFKGIFDVWQQGYEDEEAEQPDRASLIEKISKTLDAKRVYSFMKYKKEQGLDTTLVLKEMYPDLSDAKVRSLACNFTQVTSIIFPPFAQFLSHLNPLED